MDRKDQLRNVAFGGAWSEQIAAREELVRALNTLAEAARRSNGLDVRVDMDVVVSLWRACQDHPKGEMLSKAWDRAAAIPNSGLRQAELSRLAGLLKEGHRARLG